MKKKFFFAENLNNTQLQAQSQRVKLVNQQKYQSAFPSLQSQNRLQELVYRIRQQNVNQLTTLLSKLEKNCIKNGIGVFWVEDYYEAQQVLLDLFHKHSINKIVKTKCAVGEEIGLTSFLQDSAIDFFSTDIGEYILSLQKELSNYPKMADIHLSDEQIKEIFTRKFPKYFGEKAKQGQISLSDVTDKFRIISKQKCTAAQAGITGVDFAVAETGSLVLLDNEGASGHVTLLPNIHIALMSLEQVIASMSELPVLVNALSRTTTGQKITNYVNIINYPAQDYELEGPRKIYLLILDNKRSTMFNDPLLAESLRCINCNACSNYSSVYWAVGASAYKNTKPGPIGQIIAAQSNLEKNKHLLFMPSIDNLIDSVCPAKIPISKILLKLRCKKYGNLSFIERFWWAFYSFIGTKILLFRFFNFCLKIMPNFVFSLLPFARSWQQFHNIPKMSPRFTTKKEKSL